MTMQVGTVFVNSCNFDQDETIQARFEKALQDVIDSGGQIISVMPEKPRSRKAYVLRKVTPKSRYNL